MKNIKRLLVSVLALIMIVSTVFTMSACDTTNNGGNSDDPSNPPAEWGDDIQITPGQNGYGGEGKIKITFKATYANETDTARVTVNASSATVEAFVRDFLASPLGDMLFTELFPYGVWELNGTIMTMGDATVTLRDGDVLHLKLHSLPTQMGGSISGTVDGSCDFDNPDEVWGDDVTTTPGQNGYGSAGEIKVGFKISFRGEEDEVVIVVAAQSITLEALIRDYLDGPLGGMSFTEILPYGSWYYNGSLMGPNGYTQVLKDRDVISLAMRKLPGQEDDNGGSGGTKPDPDDPSAEFVKVSVKSSDGFDSHKHIVTASSGTEPLYSIVFIAVGVDMEELLAKGVTIFVNDVAVTAKNHPIRNGDHVVLNVVGTDLDSDQGASADRDYTVDVLLMYANNTYESEGRDVYSPMTLADFLEEYVEISFDKSLAYGKWRVNGVDVSDGSYVLRGGECVMFRQNGLNNSDDWGTGIKGTATTHGNLSYSYNIVIPTEGITAGEFYNLYFNSVFGIDLDKALHENDLLFLVNDCRIFDAKEAEKVMVYPDSPVKIYWYSIPEGYEDTFTANMTAPADASVCLSFLDGSADYIGFWTVSGYTVRQTFELHGYNYEYYSQFGYFCDSDDRRISGNSLLPEDGYFRWVQETPFPELDLTVDPDGDFAIKLGFKFEDQFKEETVHFDKEGLTLYKFVNEYLSEEYFDGMDYNNLSKYGSWYFENERCTKDTVIADGGYLEFRMTTMPEDGSFDDLFDTPTPEKTINITVDASAFDKTLPPITVSVPVGTSYEKIIELALRDYGYSYEDTVAAGGQWKLPGLNPKDGDTLTYVANGGSIQPPIVLDDFLIQFTETYPNGEITGISLSVKFKTGEIITVREFAEQYVLSHWNMTFEETLEVGTWYVDGNRALPEKMLFKKCALEFRRNEGGNPGGGDGVETIIIVTVDVSGLFADNTMTPDAVALTLPEGATLRDAVNRALESYGLTYDDTADMSGYWVVNGSIAQATRVLKSRDEIQFVKIGGGDGGDPAKQIIVYVVTLNDTGMQLMTPVYVKEGATLAEFVREYAGTAYETMVKYGYFTVNDSEVEEGGAYVLKDKDRVKFIESDIGGDANMILVYLTAIFDGQPETEEVELVMGSTLRELADVYTTWGYDGSLAYGYWRVNGANVENPDMILNNGDEVEFFVTSTGGDTPDEKITVYYETRDENGNLLPQPIQIPVGMSLYEFVSTYAGIDYKESTVHGYWTINGIDVTVESAYEPLLEGDVIAFVANGDVGGDEHTHEWNAENGTCFTCGEPCPVDHATEAIYGPCYNCGFAGYAGGGYEHRMINVYVNGTFYTSVTVVYMPGEYPTLDDALRLTDLGLFADLNENYVILTNEREAEWTSGNNKMHYDTEIYINDRPEEIPPVVQYTVYFTKFYPGDNWQSGMKSMWNYINGGTSLSDAFMNLGDDVWENDRIWVNGTLVTDWNDVTIESDTYIVILAEGIENPSITATVVDETTGKTRKVVYDAPVYFGMVRDDLIGTLPESMTWNLEVNDENWGTSVIEYAIAHDFTVTIKERTTEVSIKVVGSDGTLSLMTQTVKGALPTLGEFVKTYLGGDPEAYYFASVDGGELRELTADDTVPQFWGYMIPKAQIKDEITITYDVTSRDNGQITGSVTVKSPVLLYQAFREAENAWEIESVLWDSWKYAISVDGVALSEEDKGGSFLLLWSDCTLTAEPIYYVRVEYMEFIGEFPPIDPILVTDLDMTVADVLAQMDVDTSMFFLDIDLSMRVGDLPMYGDNEFVIYARPKTLRFEIVVPDMYGGDTIMNVEGFMGSVTLEEVQRRFAETHGIPAEDYVWLYKDYSTGEQIELTDSSYTWYYNEETQNGEFYLSLFLKNIRVQVDILDRNGNMIEWREVIVENGAPVLAVLEEFGYTSEDVMQILNMTYGYSMSLDEGIAQPIALQIWLNSGTTSLHLYIVGDNGYEFVNEEYTFEGSVTVARILSDRGYSAEYVRWVFLDGADVGIDEEINGGSRIEIQMIYYPVYFYVEDAYGNFVVEVYEWIWGRITVGELLERYGNGYTWDQIASGDCASGEAFADTVIEHEDKIMLRLYPTGEGGGNGEIIEPTMGFEVFFEGQSYWMATPVSLYDFICMHLNFATEDGMMGAWYVDGMYVESIYDYMLSSNCTVYRENIVEPTMGFEVNCNGYVFWLEGPMSLHDFAYKMAYDVFPEFVADPENTDWIIDGERVDFYTYTLSYSCKIDVSITVSDVDAVA